MGNKRVAQVELIVKDQGWVVVRVYRRPPKAKQPRRIGQHKFDYAIYSAGYEAGQRLYRQAALMHKTMMAGNMTSKGD